MARYRRLDKIVDALRSTYPDAECALHFKNPLQLLVATILSAQSTDKRVNMVTPALFRKYKTARAFANSEPAELEEMVHSTGFFRNKARNIRAACAIIDSEHGGKVPDDMDPCWSRCREWPGKRQTWFLASGSARPREWLSIPTWPGLRADWGFRGKPALKKSNRK